MIIQEASTYVKKYKCPYCDFRADRKKLISHIEKKHPDLIPSGFTATRLVFNIINKKETGTCTECGKETKWNENKARYERICENPKCMEAYLKKVKSRMVNTYGIDNLLGDPKHQEKMLANRKISGKYKFSDGGEKQYTGSYERKTLEFFDKILHCKSEDIITPGPVIEYVFKGKPHIWITDILYVPYNLVIEVKDGGSNPNNRPMQEYREKQIAKEKAIVADKKFNYLRLTNNNFLQLFQIFGELKMQLIEDNRFDRIVSINEEMFSSIGAMLPMNTNDTYIINYGKNNVFSGTAFSEDNSFESLFVVKEDIVELVNGKEFLKEYDTFDTYSVSNANIEKIKSYHECGYKVDSNFIAESCLGKKIYTKDDYLLSENVKPILPIKEYSNYITSITEATIRDKESTLTVDNLKSEGIVEYCMDMNGYFIRNKNTKIRTESYDDFNDISKTEYSIIENGVIL